MPRQYLTVAPDTDKLPGGIPYIIGNETAERFSFYGMKAILVIFMTKYLLDSAGNKDLLGKEEATAYYHLFTGAVYFTPILGAIIADAFLGKYRTILSLSIVYCAGHLTLALNDTQFGLALGLGLIALGSGGIKPCVSAHVGDQFGRSNQPMLEKVFSWFYFSINLGAFASTLLTPWLLANYGPHVAFGIPGLLMALATLFFWMGRNVFVHIPAGGIAFIKETFSRKGLPSLGNLFVIYAFVAMFWALFDQTGSAWVLQAERMDRNFMGFEWLSSQIQAINPIMIMVLIPVFIGVKALRWPGLYHFLNRVYPLTPLRKIGIGFFLTVPAFLIPAWVETQLQAGHFVNIVWQLVAYAVITAAEVFISITCLEFSYTQAPRKMKSLIMACFLVSISIGNLFVSGVNFFIQEEGPSFRPDVPGVYRIQLSVSDGKKEATTQFSVTVLNENPPHEKNSSTKETKKNSLTADAGTKVAVKPKTEVRMYATADRGEARGKQTYSWSLIDKPKKSKLSTKDLRDADTRNPTFKPDVSGTYKLEFTFNVGKQKATDTVSILATDKNAAPIAVADDIVWAFDEKHPIALDGSDSFDPDSPLDNNSLKVRWKIIETPQLSMRTKDDIAQATRLTSGSKLSGANYYYFFALCMLVTALLYIPVAMRYKVKSYIPGETEPGNGNSEP